jgi:Ca-activated chloride channel family protein
VVVEVTADGGIEFVQLTVDGAQVGRLTSPPFNFAVSVGEKNQTHRFEVEAVGIDGTRGSASVATPAIQVDDFVELALRQTYVTVSDRSDQRVLGLESDDFQIFDDNDAQRIVTFAGGEIPFSAILLIDGSESMIGPQIAAARTGARTFLAGMNELDEAKVIVFSTRLLAASTFAGREEPLSQLVESVTPDGGTAINDFLFLGLQRLEQRHGRRVLVLLSDGFDVHSVLRMEQVAGVARQSQAQIYWLRLKDERLDGGDLVNSWRDSADSRRQMRLLEKVIRESGGRILAVEKPNEIEGAFQEVLAELREQYALGYYPDKQYGDGRWRQLKVQVRGPYKVKAREGYLDLP